MSSTFGYARFICTHCKKTYLEEPPEGLCTRCPDEPVFDLSDPAERREAERLIENAELTRKSKIGIVGLFIGVFVGAVAFLVVMYFSEDILGDAAVFALFPAVLVFLFFTAWGGRLEEIIRGESSIYVSQPRRSLGPKFDRRN